MDIHVYGPQGCGKSTLSTFIVENFYPKKVTRLRSLHINNMAISPEALTSKLLGPKITTVVVEVESLDAKYLREIDQVFRHYRDRICSALIVIYEHTTFPRYL